jgi:molecular chaperone GrpE
MTMADQTFQPPADDAAALLAELEAAKAEAARLKDIAGRAQADLQNAKQRLEREAADMRSYAAEGVILRILPTLDNFQRAFGAVPKDIAGHEWTKGVTSIEQDLFKQLSELGLRRMESLGATVDPATHDVITVGPGPEGTVVEVFEEGYLLNGKVIRHAKVRAGNGEAA